MQRFFAILVQGAGIFIALIVFSSFSAGITANLLGCPLNEGSPNSCMLFDRDIGQQLYEEGLMFLYIFIGLPLWGALIFVGGLFWSRRAYKRNPTPMPKWAWRTLMIVGGVFAGAILLVPITNAPGTPSLSVWWPQALAYVVFNTLPFIVGAWLLIQGLRERRRSKS